MHPAIFFGIFSAIAVAIAGKMKTANAAGLVMAVEEIGGDVGKAFLPRGYRNNNPGNLRFIAKDPFNGQTGQDSAGYGIYSTMAFGYRAMGRQLLNYEKRGLRTVRHIIGGDASRNLAGWAPAIENDTVAYIADVSRRLAVLPDAVLSVGDRLVDLAEAIAIHENGYALHSRAQVQTWVRAQ